MAAHALLLSYPHSARTRPYSAYDWLWPLTLTAHALTQPITLSNARALEADKGGSLENPGGKLVGSKLNAS